MNINDFREDLNALFAKHELFYATHLTKDDYRELADMLHDTALLMAEHDPSVGIQASSQEVVRLLETFKDVCSISAGVKRKCKIKLRRAYIYNGRISNDPFVDEFECENVGHAYAIREEYAVYPLSNAPFFKTEQEAMAWAAENNIEIVGGDDV